MTQAHVSSRSLFVDPTVRSTTDQERWQQHHAAMAVIRANCVQRATVHPHVAPRRYLSEGGSGIFGDMKKKMQEEEDRVR